MVEINVAFFIYLFVKDIGAVIQDDRETDLKVSFLKFVSDSNEPK